MGRQLRRSALSVTVLAGVLLLAGHTAASTTDGTIDTTSKYAWGENVGWLNFGTSQGNTHVLDAELTGYAWGENVGWVSLNCSNTNSCGTVSYKVSNDREGNLTGYAWGENLGWVSVNCANTSSCATVDYKVTVTSSGEFRGYAWSENAGWIVFNCATTSSCATVDYKVATDWRPESARGQPLPLPSPGGGGGAPPDTTPPAEIANVILNGADERVVLTWRDPTDPDLARIEVLRNSGGETPVGGVAHARVNPGVRRFQDADVVAGTTYRYRFRTIDTTGNVTTSPDYTVTVEARVVVELPTELCPAAPSPPTVARRAPSAENFGTDAQLLLQNNATCLAHAVGRARDEVAEQIVRTTPAYVEILRSAPIERRGTPTAFLAYGTPTTLAFSVEDRARAIFDYRTISGELPSTAGGWSNAVRLATSHYPATPNPDAERSAQDLFRRMLGRDPTIRYAAGSTSVLDADIGADRLAVRIAAYGLRQRTRDVATERRAIATFREVFRRSPQGAEDWKIVRAIAYAGAPVLEEAQRRGRRDSSR